MTNIIATTSNVVSLGGLVYWDQNGYANHDDYTAALTMYNVPRHIHPNFTDPKDAVERAINDVLPKKRGRGGSNIDVTSMRSEKKNHKLYLVHRKHRNKVEESVAFSEDLKVRLSSTGRVTCEPFDHPVAATLLTRYEYHLEHLNANDVSAVNTAMVRECNGARMRARGGMYFIAAQYLPEWQKLVDATTDVTDHVFHHIPADDLDSVRKAVLSGFTGQIEAELSKVESVLEKEPGKRGLQTQLKTAADLQRQMNFYKSLLGETLDDLTEKVDELEANVTMLALAASGTEDNA